jgi:hypothetical protein
VTSEKIQDGTIQFEDIGQNSADSGQVMKWDGSEWVSEEDREYSFVSSGIAYSYLDSSSSHFSGNFINIMSVLMNVPSDGFIELQFSSYTQDGYFIGLGTEPDRNDIALFEHIYGAAMHTIS